MTNKKKGRGSKKFFNLRERKGEPIYRHQLQGNPFQTVGAKKKGGVIGTTRDAPRQDERGERKPARDKSKKSRGKASRPVQKMDSEKKVRGTTRGAR